MSKFEDLIPPGTDALWRELRSLRAEVEELRAARSVEATTVSAGSFVVDGAGSFVVKDLTTGLPIFEAGIGSTLEKSVVNWYRGDGSLFLGIGAYLETGEQVGTWRDANLNVLIADDRLGVGLNRPWLTIPGTHQFEGVATEGTVFPYRSLPIAAVATEQNLWEGRIPLVSHGFIDFYGTWGSSTGSSNCTYNLYVANDFIGSWSTTGTELRSGRASGADGFDITQYIGFGEVRVQINCVATGTGNVACEVYSPYMRGAAAP